MSDVKAWDTSAANNTSAPPNGAPEGMAPSTVNNVLREIMAADARLYADTNGSLTTGGTSNAYTLTPNQTYTAYARGDHFLLEANHTNTGAATLNVSALGTQSIVLPDGSALSGGEIQSGGVYLVAHDGTNFQLVTGQGGQATFTDLTVDSLDISDTTTVDLANGINPLNVGVNTTAHMALDANDIQAKSDATTATTLNVNQFGGNVNIGPQSGSGSSVLYESGAVAARTASNGIVVRHGSADDPKVSLRDSADTEMGYLQHIGGSSLSLLSVEHGIPVRLAGENAGGSVQNVFLGDPDGTATMYYAGTATLATNSNGIAVSDPDGGGTVAIDLGSELAMYSNGTLTRLDSRIHGGNFELRVENSLGTAQDVLFAQPDNTTILFYAGTAAVRTTSTGVLVNASETGTDAILQLLDGDSEGAAVIKDDNGAFLLRNSEAAGTFQIQVRDAGDTTNQTGLIARPDGEVELYYDGTLAMETTASGAKIQDTSGSAPAAQLASDAGTVLSELESDGSHTYLQGLIHGGNVYLQSEDAGGTNRTLFVGDPDGAAALYFDGSSRLATTSTGTDVSGSALRLDNSGAATATAFTMFNSEGGIQLRADNDVAVLYQTDATGAVEDTWVRCENNADVALFYNNTEKLRTADETATDQGTGADTRDGGGTMRPVGLHVTPITAVSANTDLRLANSGFQLRATTASITIDMDTTTNSAPDGAFWTIVNESGGDISITATGVTLTWLDGAGGSTGARTLADGSYVTVTKRADSQYQIVGNGLS